MPPKGIPEDVQQQAETIIAAFNQTQIDNPQKYYIPRYKGQYLYLDRVDFGHRSKICRLLYMNQIDNWKFEIFRYSNNRYESSVSFFRGAEHIDGTIEGAMRAGLAAYPA